MKWLKKNSSDNEQIPKAESQPEPEREVEQAIDEIFAPETETLEQPVNEQKAIEQAQAPPKQSSRRREKRATEEEIHEKKTRFNLFRTVQNSWIGANWKVFVILLAIFCLAFFARAYYGLEPATEDGFVLSGGSDSYYHHWVITNGYETGDFHFWDNMLNYPVGTRNPRPPLYDWSVTLGGKALSPFFDGDVYTSTFYVFIFSTAFWGALTVVPTYFLGKEAFGRKTGIIAAFLLAVLPGHVQRSVLTNADHDAMTLFFIVTSFFFFLKALKLITQREWVVNWEKPRDIVSGTKLFIKSNPQSILYGVLAGLSITGVALIWQGFAYVIVLISVYFLVQILLNRFRNVDSFGVFIIYFVAIGVGLLLAFPYYYQSIQIPSWFDTPTYLFLGLSAFALVLMATRKYPWFLVFSSMIAVALLTIILLMALAPSILDTMINALLSGGGYFINNKQYQTIAEAQAPPFSNLALSFGIITFWLSFIGVAWAAIQLPKSWKPDFTFILLWAGTSIYMAVSAARFMFNAAPAFAITSAWVIAIIIDKLNLGRYISDIKRASKPTMTPNLKIGLVVSVAAMFVLFLVLTSISTMAFPVFVVGIVAICGIYMLNLIAETNPNRMYNLLTILVPISAAIFYILSEFYWSFEFTDATHLFILALLLFAYGVLFIQVRRISFFFTMGVVFLAFCVVVPNVWAGIDAGIPYETKADLDKQIYNAMPSFLQPSDYDVQNGTNWYLGGFGYSLPLNSRYWPAAYDWLATQDKDIYPVTQRPAFLSWWDYGFEVVNEGQHPTVADNFLGGHQLAGNFIMAQSEKDAIALLCVRLLEGNWYNHWEGIPNSFDAEILDIMDLHGIDSSKMIDMFENPSKYVDIILKNPDIYGPRDEIIQDVNANYIAARVLITQNLNDEQVVNLYRDISRITGTSIRYFGIDSRLFPFSAQNTGIFYAPAKLSDHRISDIANQPYDFWEIKAIGEFGGEYDLDAIPSDVRLNPETPYKIVYKEMFYNSMLYKAFIGYSGYDIGQGEAGIPALSGDLASSPIMPGWNMSHFKLVHRTSYWNPYSANEIQNHTDAWRAMNYWDAYEKQQAGEGISDLSDRSSLYQGTMMLKYYHGAVISGKVVLKDGTPLGGVSVTVMDDFGIPHQRVVTDNTGYYSLIAPPGDITLIASTGSIDPMYLIGNSINQTAMFIYDYQAMRLDEDRNSDGKPDWQIEQNMIVEGSSMSGLVFWDVDSDGTISDADYKIDNTEVSIINSDMAFNAQTLTDESGEYNFTSIPPGTYDIKVTYANRNIGTLQVTISSNEDMYQDLAISTTTLTGIVSYNDGSIARGVKVRLWNTEENIEFTRYTDQNGTYHFESLLHGRFLIQAESDAFASIPQILDIVQFEYNIQNVTMYSSFLWSGTVTLNDNPVPYCTIKFAGASDSVIVADSSGRFKARLLDGNYFYYVSHTLNNNIYSAIGRLYATEDQIKNIVLGAGSLVIGHATDENGVRVANTQIVFNNVNSGTYISANTDSSGDYSIIIPHGAYRIQISSDSYGSYYAVHEFNSRTNVLNLKTRPAEPVYGSVFWDVDSNGVMGEDEYIGDARVTFKEPTGAYAQAITDENGLFLIYLPSSVSYDVVVSRDGFYPVNLGVQTHSSLSQGIHQFLEPIYIPVSGGIYLDDELLQDQNIILHFDSQIDMLPSKEIQVARDGTYSGQLIPGYYAVAFTHNVSIGNDSEVYQIDEKFIIDTSFYDGEPLQLDITAVQRTKISVTIANPEITGANITFKQGPESRNFNMNSNYEEFYLKPGNYVMSAVHPLNDSIMVDMKDVSVDDVPNNYTVSLKRGVSYSGTLKYGPNAIPYQKITFQDMNSNGTITVFSSESGTYEIILVPNLKYQIIVDFVDYETEPYLKAYRYYTLDHTIDAFTSMSNQIILLEREDFSSVLIGRVTYNGILAPGTELIFTSEFATHRVVTDEFGEYSLDIIPAEYTVYAHHPSHYVSLFKIQIEIDQDILDIDLVPGVRVYGTAYYDMNKIAMTSIEFTSNSVTRSISTDSTGYYEIWLPAASYSLKSEMKSMKYGIEVTYSAAINFELKSDKQMNIPLSMIEERVVFVSFDLTQLKVIDSNSSVRYTFDVENMGNIRDTYTLAATGGTLDWIIDFSVSEVTVDPGAENKVRLSMNVFIPASTKTTQNTITVTAISQKDSTVRHSNVMNVPIRQKHGFVIQPSATSPQLDAGDIKSEFSILNKGNGVDSLTVYIANNEDLLRNGWSVELGSLGGSESMNDGKRLVNVSVNSGSTINIPIYLTPSNENPSRQANVLVIAYSQIDNAFITSNNIILQYPILQMSSDNLTAAGLGVSEAQSGDQLVNVGVMVASVSAALLIFYFARKKRWIR